MFYTYRITYVNEVSFENEEKYGFIPGDSYGDAVASLLNYYGEDSVEGFYIDVLSPDCLLEFDNFEKFSEIAGELKAKVNW